MNVLGVEFVEAVIERTETNGVEGLQDMSVSHDAKFGRAALGSQW